ncbi:MAG: RsiV family protein [Enterococcaceae bacterium]|nr:RsiV family protein [Enterococcaceae bacterium]MCI1918609.1 RsiV family protein [Enterococcaceae bacterium]
MNSSKKIISLLAQKYQQQETPDSLKEELRARLNLEETRLAKKKKRKHWTITAISAAIPLFLVGLIFLNTQVRSYAADLPVLGPIVRLLTGEKYVTKKGNSSVEVSVPKIDADTPAAKTLNEKYLADGQAAYQKAVAELGDFNDQNFQLTAGWQKVVDDSRFLVVKRETTETAADSATTLSYDTIDKKEDVVLSLPLLFKNDQYQKVITTEIQRQIAEQMKASDSAAYWTQADIDSGMVDPIQWMKPDRAFYINQKHQLVIVFPEFEIAPGSMGSPEFVIPTKTIRSLLVDPDYLN